MRFLSAFIFVSVTIWTTHSLSAPLDEPKDELLIAFANNAVLIAESKKEPIAVRIYGLQNFGECDGTGDNCPKTSLYIAVSEFGEYPDQKLYKLDEANIWKFIHFISFPKYDHETSFVKFLVERTDRVRRSSESPQWMETKKLIEVSVNPHASDTREQE
ncbi:MAG: hypothetical protein Q7T44_01145 [Parvibaculum sp.]|nr:hypothetical protein [Parvibaculum sp.]